MADVICEDPLFFLHHAQIDRLWWLWQQQDVQKRSHEFSGPVASKDQGLTSEQADLHDTIKVLGLAEDVSVDQVMITQSDLLCYKYKREP